MQHSSDLGNGTFQNPVLYGDYSDPDAIRVGDDYYLISSSFSNSPAIPVLHSKDCVNWKVINYVCRNIPEYRYINPCHGAGVWAPAIRYHKGEYYVYFPMPDEGIYVSKTSDPYGEWSKPVRILAGAGYIDPCPFWEDDKTAYLVCGIALSRYGKKSLLLMAPLSPDGMTILGEFQTVYDGNDTENETIEGPKLYKRNGYYYIFAPAGGVKVGHQVVLRSRNIYGPYEYRIVLKQGNTLINGPHQGALIDTPSGDYFMHFQDVYAGGRIVHMQPVIWEDDWPVIGKPVPGETYGEPMDIVKKPVEDSYIYAPDCDDDFSGNTLGLQWQWNANYESSWFDLSGEHLKLFADYKNPGRSLSDVRNLLLQKWPMPEFVCTTKMDLAGLQPGNVAGIVSLGQTFAGLAVECTEIGDYAEETAKNTEYAEEGAPKNRLSYQIVTTVGEQEFDHSISFPKEETSVFPLDSSKLKENNLQVIYHITVEIKGYTDYLDRVDYQGNKQWARHIPVEEIKMELFLPGEKEPLKTVCIPAKAGRWVGVKSGVFCYSKNSETRKGFAVVESVIYEELHQRSR